MNQHAALPSSEPPLEPAEPEDRPRIIRWIVLAIVAWGIVHAIGAWQFNHNPLRGGVVLVCVAAFLGFWMTMLAVRQRRLLLLDASRRRGAPRSNESDPEGSITKRR